MTLKDIQKQVDEWVQQYKIGYYHPLAMIAQAVEELGELSREINNRYGLRIKKSLEDTSEIEEEIADVMFAMICMANSHNIDLDKVWEKKMNKCYGRDSDGWERK